MKMYLSNIQNFISLRISRYLVMVMTSLKCIYTVWCMKYILKIYGKGFHHWNGGFLKNGFAVSYLRTAGTWSPDYS